VALQGRGNDTSDFIFVMHNWLIAFLSLSSSTQGPTVSNEHKPSPDLVVNGQKFAVVG